MQANIGERAWTTVLGRAGRAVYLGVMNHPSVVATGVTPETLAAAWGALAARAGAIAGIPAVLATGRSKHEHAT